MKDEKEEEAKDEVYMNIKSRKSEEGVGGSEGGRRRL